MANEQTKKQPSPQKKGEKKDEKKSIKGKVVAGIIFSIIGGFSIGVVSTLGGLFGAGYYLLNGATLKDSVDTVETITGQEIDYSQFITDELASNTVIGAVQQVASLAQEAQDGTLCLSSLERFTPMVRTTVEDNLLPFFESYGVTVSSQELLSTPFSELGDFIGEAINGMEIGKAISSFSGSEVSGLILMFAYGEENYEYVQKTTASGNEIVMLGNNRPVVVGDFMEEDKLSELLSHLSLAAFMEAAGGAQQDEPLMRAILYGEEGVDYDVVGGEVVMKPRTYTFESNVFTDTESGITYTYNNAAQAWYNTQTGYAIVTGQNGYDYVVVDGNGEIVEFLQSTAGAYNVHRFPADGPFTPANAVVQRRRGITVDKIMQDGIDTDIIMTMRIADIVGPVDQATNPLMYTIANKGWKVGDINAANINTLKLGEVIAIPNDPTSIMYLLRNEEIGNLENAINGLTIKEVLGNHVEAHRFLKHLANTPISNIESAMNDLKVVDVFSDKVYQPGTTTLTGTWKYMLTDPNGVMDADDYTFNDFDSLINNLSTTIKTATLADLKADGVLNLTNVDTSQSTIMGQSISMLMKTLVDSSCTQSTLGELSIQDLLTIVAESE